MFRAKVCKAFFHSEARYLMSTDRPTKTKKISDKFSGGRYLNAVSYLKDLTGVQRAILRDIASQVSHHDFYKWRYMTFDQLEERTGFSRSSCLRSVSHLIEAGYLLVERKMLKGRQAPNNYRLTAKVFAAYEALLSVTETPSNGVQSVTETPSSELQSVTVEPTECHSDYVQSVTVTMKLPHTSLSPPSIYTGDASVAPAERPKIDLRSALAPPRRLVTPLMIKHASATVLSCFRSPGYFPEAEWTAETRRLLGSHDAAAFDALGTYMIATDQRGIEGRVASDLEAYLKAAAAWHINPDSPEAYVTKIKSKGGNMVQHIAPKVPERYRGVPKTDYWVACLEKREILQWLKSPKVSAADKTALRARWIDLGGSEEELA